MSEVREYDPGEVCAFCRPGEDWGVLSNFWPLREPIEIHGLVFTTSEALFQALKHPYDPALQERIAAAPRAAHAKRIAWGAAPPLDWDRTRVQAMRCVLRWKTVTNLEPVRRALHRSGDRDLVEVSPRDDWWGARRLRGRLVGCNVLGRLWMELRAEARERRRPPPWEPHAEGLYLASRALTAPEWDA